MLRKTHKNVGVVIDPTQVESVTPMRLVAGIDAGSTQTRVFLADDADVDLLNNGDDDAMKLEYLNSKEYIIPSTYAVVPDEREIQAVSGNLEDNYDSRIILLKNSAKKPMLSRERVIRGRRILDTAGMVSRFMDSATNKTDNQVFYVNVLDGIGYAIMQKYSGNIPTAVEVHLALSVRPKERNAECSKVMNSNFIGEYQFCWNSVSIRINIVETMYTTEPEAQLGGTGSMKYLQASVYGDEDAQMMSDKLFESENYIHIEGGGSSIGVEIALNRKLSNACSATFQLGGNYLQRVVRDRLRELRGHNVSEDSVASAITSCLLKNGRSQEDVSEVIADCKNSVALEIFERLRHDAMDLAKGITMRDIEFITLGGRLFSTDDAGNSIAQYFAQYVAQLSPNTEVVALTDNYIPQGNAIDLINAMTEDGKYDNLGADEVIDEAELNG